MTALILRLRASARRRSPAASAGTDVSSLRETSHTGTNRLREAFEMLLEAMPDPLLRHVDTANRQDGGYGFPRRGLLLGAWL